MAIHNISREIQTTLTPEIVTGYHDKKIPYEKLTHRRKITKTSESGMIPLHSSFSATAQKAHVFPSLTSASLISIGQLCDNGCTAILNNKALTIYKNGHPVLRGIRNLVDGLWDIDLTAHAKIFDTHHPNQTTEKMNAIIRRDKTKLDLA